MEMELSLAIWRNLWSSLGESVGCIKLRVSGSEAGQQLSRKMRWVELAKFEAGFRSALVASTALTPGDHLRACRRSEM